MVSFFGITPPLVFILLSLTGLDEFSMTLFLVVAAVTIAIIYGIILWKARSKNKIIFYIIVSSLLLATIFMGLFVFYSARQSTLRTVTHRDGKRIGDVKQLQLALDFYYEENNRYPAAESGCYDTSSLEVLVSSGFIFKIPQEALKEYNHPSYHYAVSEDGSQYILQATLSNEQHTVLDNQFKDMDGNILGCDCNDPNYCVGSVFN